MPELPDVFKASEEPTLDEGFETIPPGWYPAEITRSEFKKTASGNGKYLKLTFRISDGDFTGRFVWSNLNLIHVNETTVQIAKRELSSICKALNIESVIDSDELHNQPLQIQLAIRPASGKYPEGNDIKGYRNIDESDESDESDGDNNSPF